MKYRTLSMLAAMVVSVAMTRAQAADTATGTLHSLFEEAWERELSEDPESASRLGIARYNARWSDRSLAAIEQSHRQDIALLAALDRIDPAELSAADRLNRELFQRKYQGAVDEWRYRAFVRPLNQRGGAQSLHQLAEVLPFRDRSDYADWIARLRTIDVRLEQTTELLRMGIAERNVQPRVIMERIPEQIRRQIVDDPAASPFFTPFLRMPETIGELERDRLTEQALTAISRVIVPAYRRFLDFFEQQYLPASRASTGIDDTPAGSDWYQNRVSWYTTTNSSAAEIHELGLTEVRRIRAAMLELIERTGFEGGFEEFLAFLRTDPRFRYRDADELFRAYVVMAKRIDPLLTGFFGKLPRTPYGVRAIPAETAPDTTTAYYQPPAVDGSRAGYYYVNLYRPEERPTYEIPVLTIHEAVPGHHLQIALAMEQTDLPEFRRYLEATAYVEGWALYSESLGEEMGLYDDPYDKFGQLTYDMWRAVRLVVDTGLHARQWTREQAIAFFRSNAPKSELDIVNEIDRYIAMPGQALAYKVGELKIRELRARAAERLGERFDLRQFHDVVLGTGAVPLDVLEQAVDAWIEANLAAAAQRGKLAAAGRGRGLH